MSENTKENSVFNSNVVCRGCLKWSDKMKNLVDGGLDDDFFTYTDTPRDLSEGMPQMLCEECEINLQNVKKFKTKCQLSDKILRANRQKKMLTRKQVSRVQVSTVLRNKMLYYLITAPDPDDKIPLKCPHKLCDSEFYKKIHVINHLRKAHNIDLEIQQQFYCSEKKCVYNMTSDPTKYFTGRKFLNQHYSKMHKEKIYSCATCHKKFPKITDYNRHLKSCNMMYLCTLCETTYSSNETYLVHLLRRHPDLHAKYKEEKKAIKRQPEKSEDETYTINIQLPTKMRKDNPMGVTEQKNDEAEETDKEVILNQSEESNGLQTVESIITRLQPLELNVGAFESSIPPSHYADTQNPDNERQVENNEEKKYIVHIQLSTNMSKDNLVEGTNNNNNESEKSVKEIKPNESQETNVVQVTEANVTALTPMDFNIDSSILPSQYAEIQYEDTPYVAEEYIIQGSIEGPFTENSTVNAAETTNNDEATSGNEKSTENVGVGNETDNINPSDSQIPKDVTNDVPSSSWSNKNDFEKLFNQSMRAQNGDEEIYFSESISLYDIHTQTTPFDFGLFRSNKETQSPDLSIKETQTCFCVFDAPKFNFGQFVDNVPSTSASSNVTSTETQTSEFGVHLRSDVLLSFSSAGTQTHFGDSSDDCM